MRVFAGHSQTEFYKAIEGFTRVFMSFHVGFEPLFDGNSRVLVLGSFPSVKSRAAEFYYGNPQNRFWRTLAEAFEEPVPQTTEQKKLLCLDHGVALWDIVASCEIVGSMDSDIRNYRAVDLSVVLDKAPIGRILCNGAKSFLLTSRVYRGELPLVRLPSTSPANVKFDKTQWIKQLKGD